MVDVSTGPIENYSDVHQFHLPLNRQLRKVLEPLGWLCMLTMIFVGLSSLFSRVGGMMIALPMAETEAASTLSAFDIRYYQHYAPMAAHLALGLFVYAVAPLQFMRVIRKRWPAFHRFNGKIWLIGGAIAAFTGAFFGVVWPFTGHVSPGGMLQVSANAIVGPLTLYCLYQAYMNVRSRNFGTHREWMIRAWAMMLGVATQRILMLILIPITGIGLEFMFGFCMWLGQIINISAAEIWIRLTRTPGNGNRHWKDLDTQQSSS